MSQYSLLVQLKEQLVFFFDELIELLPDEPDLVIVRIFIKDQIPIVEVMDYMIRRLVPLEHLTKTKDDSFFLNNNILFEKVDNNKVNHFRRLWLSGKLDDEDKNTIWKWFRGFIYLSKKYKEIMDNEKKLAT